MIVASCVLIADAAQANFIQRLNVFSIWLVHGLHVSFIPPRSQHVYTCLPFRTPSSASDRGLMVKPHRYLLIPLVPLQVTSLYNLYARTMPHTVKCSAKLLIRAVIPQFCSNTSRRP